MSILIRIEDLLKFKGIGLKIANLFSQIALGVTKGISVDTHCHRIPNRLKWIKTQTPNQTKVELEKIFEKKEWQFVNSTLVGFGQLICTAISPKCLQCPINQICIAEENLCKRKPQKLKLVITKIED